MHSWFQDSIHSKKQSQTTGSRPIPYPLESKQSNLPATPWWYKRVTLSPDQEECPNHAGTSKGSKQQQWCGKGQSSPTIGVDRMALGKRSWITHRHSSTKRSTFLSKSSQQDLAIMKMMTLKCRIHSSMILIQLNKPIWRRKVQRKLMSSPCLQLKTWIISRRILPLVQQITPQLHYLKQMSISKPLFNSSNPTMKTTTSRMVNLPQVNQAWPDHSSQETNHFEESERSIILDSFNTPNLLSREAVYPPLSEKARNEDSKPSIKTETTPSVSKTNPLKMIRLSRRLLKLWTLILTALHRLNSNLTWEERELTSWPSTQRMQETHWRIYL